jgi:hypothetical protein
MKKRNIVSQVVVGKKASVLVVIAAIFIATSCSSKIHDVSLADISKAVKDSVYNDYMPTIDNPTMGIKDVELKKSGDNSCQGNIVTLNYSSNPPETNKIPVSVIYDGSTITWEAEYWGSFQIAYPPVENVVGQSAVAGENNGTPASALVKTTVQEAIGRVTQNGSSFTIYSPTNSEIKRFSVPSHSLAGWGKDFFVINSMTNYRIYNAQGNEITRFSVPNSQCIGVGTDFFVLKSDTTFTTYDSRCKKISSVSVGGATSGSVVGDIFQVKVGSNTRTYDKNCRSR